MAQVIPHHDGIAAHAGPGRIHRVGVLVGRGVVHQDLRHAEQGREGHILNPRAQVLGREVRILKLADHVFGLNSHSEGSGCRRSAVGALGDQRGEVQAVGVAVHAAAARTPNCSLSVSGRRRGWGEDSQLYSYTREFWCWPDVEVG